MAVIPVALGGRSYEVRIGHGLLEQAATHLGPLLRKTRVAIVADANALDAQGDRLAEALRGAGHELAIYTVAPGEASKSWTELARLTDWLLAEGVERGDNVIALGGGVVGDLAGFACAILKRGCGFIQVPTTLLAQVDSSVGGKTAINTAAGKNLIGAFHQPSLVLADLDTLATLPPRELRAGYAEILKYGMARRCLLATKSPWPTRSPPASRPRRGLWRLTSARLVACARSSTSVIHSATLSRRKPASRTGCSMVRAWR
jgi:3-dehydroquinate synthase